ncbi:MAG: hypothetical protein AB1846_13390 [Chloroflexota bacterium]
MPFDLTLLPLNRQKGQELPSLPGLLAVAPPRKTARGREQDRLVVLLAINGSAPLTTADYLGLTGDIANRFYQSPGSVTSALRSAADFFNQALLERNLSTSGRGQYSVGWLVLGAQRGGQFYLLQSGPTHAFHLGAEARIIHDPELSGRGLGLSQTLAAYLSFLELQPGDQLVLATQVLAGWEGIVTERRGPVSLEITRRRLLAAAGAELSAVLIQVQAGMGEVNVLRNGSDRPESAPEPGPAPVEETVPPAEAIPAEPAPEWPVAHVVGAPPVGTETPAAPPPAPQVHPRPYPTRPQAQTPPRRPQPEPADEPLPSDGLETFERAPSGPRLTDRAAQGSRLAARAAAGAIRGGRSLTQRTGDFFRKITPRLVPGLDSEQPLETPRSLMLALAVIIPVLIATVSFAVYSRFGRSTQYDAYILQAQALVAQAEAESDPLRQHEAWEAALQQVLEAEKIAETQESADLRLKAQGTLDNLDSIIRLAFQKAVIGLPRNLEIIRLAATESDLYMLDAGSGKALRAYLSTGSSYQYDAQFQCGPGTYDGRVVGNLVDILPMARLNRFDAAVMAIDARGNLLYCIPEEAPVVYPLGNDTNWGSVTAIAYDAANLYVLDAPERALWIYDETDGEFKDFPIYYFEQQVPTLEDVVDFAVNGDDLYLLHADGTLTTCTYSRLEDVPTRCTEPATLTDPRPGRESGAALPGVSFSEIIFAPPPDTAIYLLDRKDQAVYRFSPRSLELQNQLRGQANGETVLPAGTVSAMTISADHVLFFSIDGQVYAAPDVP